MLHSFDQRRYLIPFRSLLLPHIFTDTLVIGSGVAGMRAAIEAADHGDVIVLAKQAIDVSATAWAQGGIAAVLSEHDSFDHHLGDTVDAGAGLCEERAVRTLVEEGPDRIKELIGWGMKFDRDEDGALSLAREGGHHHRRVLHAKGDATGHVLMRCLVERLQGVENVRIFDRCFALDLLTTAGNAHRDDAQVLGAVTHHPKYGLQIIWARATVLASGGAGQLYRETTNPRVATGDGMAMAYRAGAVVADVEFMQFHPTALYIAGAMRSLISEAVRGEGANLVDRTDRRFMADYHPDAELAPRDVVSRAMISHLARIHDSHVFLDARHMGSSRFAERFPGIADLLGRFDLDAGRDLIPVSPCAHYTIGGVWCDFEGRSSLPGLYTCGEAACNGLHGANRLASNSLLEGLVFGQRTGRACREMMDGPLTPIPINSEVHHSEGGDLDLADVRSSLRSAMWRNVGIERTGAKLDDVVDMFKFWARYTLSKIFDGPDGWETQNLLTVGALISRAARHRCESRGVHYRTDHPDSDDAQRVHHLWSVGRSDPSAVPVDEPVRAGT